MDGEMPQPGGRAPAPGALALVQAFINTHYDLEGEHGAEVFSTPQGLRDWLATRDLLDRDAQLDRGDLARAIATREALRELAVTNGAGLQLLNQVADGAIVEVRFGTSGPRFVA